MKTVLLFSGGLDSIITAKLLQEQNIEVIGLYLDTGFISSDKREYLDEVSKSIGISLVYKDISKSYIDILLNPKFGYGKCMNPCVNCHANFIKEAWEYANEIGAKYVTTGEVLGQRGFSQTSGQLKKVDSLIPEIKDYILRPLSAKHLVPTIPEINGWVDREKLLDIQGKGRQTQMEYLKKYNITLYESPSGGCLLTEKLFSKKLKDFINTGKKYNYKSYQYLKFGRFFKIGNSILIVGRNKSDNVNLLKIKTNDFDYIIIKDPKSPISVLSSDATFEEREQALKIISSYVNCDSQYITFSMNYFESVFPKEHNKEDYKQFMVTV